MTHHALAQPAFPSSRNEAAELLHLRGRAATALLPPRGPRQLRAGGGGAFSRAGDTPRIRYQPTKGDKQHGSVLEDLRIGDDGRRSGVVRISRRSVAL